MLSWQANIAVADFIQHSPTKPAATASLLLHLNDIDLLAERLKTSVPKCLSEDIGELVFSADELDGDCAVLDVASDVLVPYLDVLATIMEDQIIA